MLERSGDRLFALRANHPAMLADVEAFFAVPGAPHWHETAVADYERIERRRRATTQDTA